MVKDVGLRPHFMKMVQLGSELAAPAQGPQFSTAVPCWVMGLTSWASFLPLQSLSFFQKLGIWRGVLLVKHFKGNFQIFP